MGSRSVGKSSLAIQFVQVQNNGDLLLTELRHYVFMLNIYVHYLVSI